MKHQTFPTSPELARPAAWRVVQFLRAWPLGPGAQELCHTELMAALGPLRAGFCLRAFDDLHGLLTRHGWHNPVVLRPGARGLTDDEAAIARFVLTAVEQDRELALAEAALLVTPQAILPLVCAAERVGLPLLCEECRERLNCPLTFQ